MQETRHFQNWPGARKSGKLFHLHAAVTPCLSFWHAVPREPSLVMGAPVNASRHPRFGWKLLALDGQQVLVERVQREILGPSGGPDHKSGVRSIVTYTGYLPRHRRPAACWRDLAPLIWRGARSFPWSGFAAPPIEDSFHYRHDYHAVPTAVSIRDNTVFALHSRAQSDAMGFAMEKAPTCR